MTSLNQKATSKLSPVLSKAQMPSATQPVAASKVNEFGS